MEQYKFNFRQDFVKLLDLLALVDDANESTANDERLTDARWLVKKLICHALTVLHLSFHGTNIQELPSFKSSKIRFVDSASIDVLIRATLESFLVFHYVFYSSNTAEKRDYRYWSYKAAGLAEKQGFPTITQEARQILDIEKAELDKLHAKLESNAIFQSLSPKQQAKIFSGKGDWKWEPHGEGKVGWDSIATNAGLSKTIAQYAYSYLSRNAHSDYLSVIQMRQILMSKGKEKGHSINASIGILSIVIANMAREYRELFPLVQNVLGKDPEGNNLIEQYIQIGHSLDKHMGIGLENA